MGKEAVSIVVLDGNPRHELPAAVAAVEVM
jgi:hypothetical protein